MGAKQLNMRPAALGVPSQVCVTNEHEHDVT